jgi:hypothetical protein
MITTEGLPSSHELILAPRDKQLLLVFESVEYRSAKDRLQQYVSLLGFNNVEQARIVEQVMSRALACGDPDRLMREAMQGLHQLLAGRARRELATDGEDSIVWRSTNWRAAAWMSFSHPPKCSLTEFERGATFRLSSIPPMERRSMVPEAIEYIRCRGIWRSFVAWLLDKRAPSRLSFGRMPGK